ncbi:MAG: hypothetical protein E7Y34_01965, partial [Mycoplasma sp.]|nr:hypothetical protein [Mycoplasma sp.]
MRICSSACLNDTMPEQVKLSNDYGGKKLIKDDEYRYQWLWEIKTTNTSLLNSIMSEAMPRFGNMFFEAIKQNVPKYSKASGVYASWPSKRNFSLYRTKYSPTWPLPDYWSYSWSFPGNYTKTSQSRTRCYYNVSNALEGTYATNILIDKDKTIRGFTKNNVDYLYWSGDRPQIKRGYFSGGVWRSASICSSDQWCDTDSFVQLAYCYRPPDHKLVDLKWCWENDFGKTFCGEYEAYVNHDIYFDYLSIDKKELRLLKFDSKNKPQSGGSWPTIDKATIYDGQEPYSVLLKTITNESFINDIADRLRISRSTVSTAYSQTITNFMTYVKNQFGNITFQKVRVENATIDWGSTAYSDFYLYDYEGNTTGRTSSNLFEIQVAKEIRLRTIPIYQKQRISNHYEAAHIKDFIIGNSLGVFEVKRYLDYEARNRDSGEQIVYSATLPELYENGSITI